MAAQGNYRPRYCNTQRQVVDIKPGENVLKYIQDFFETPATEHPVLRPSLSTSSCSSPDLSQNCLLSPSKKKKSPGSALVSAVRNAFSTTCSEAQCKETCNSGDSVFLPNSPDEVEISLGSPALLTEEVPSDPEVAPQDQNGHLLVTPDQKVLRDKQDIQQCRSSNSQAMPPPLPWDTGGPELENESEFLIAESFGGTSTSWLSQPQKTILPKERCLTSPRLKSDKTTKEHNIDNMCCRDYSPVAKKGNRFSKQPQSVAPIALQSSSSKQIKTQKCPKNGPPKKQGQRQRKNTKSSARSVGKKHRVLVSEDSVSSEPKKLCSKQAELTPEDRLTLLGKRNAHVTQTLLSPEDECDRASIQEGSDEVFPSTEQQNSKMLSKRCSFERPINLNDLSGPVYNQNDKASFEHEIIIRGNLEKSNLEPSTPLEKDSVLLSSDSLKDKAVRPPNNMPCLRRSKRLRLKPLQYWRGERVMYKMKPSGGLVASGIISPKQKEPFKRNRLKQSTKLDLEEMACNANVTLKDPSQPANVFDAASKQEVLQKCVSSDDSHLLFFSNENMFICKYFSTPVFSTGKLILRPFKEKGSQYTATDTVVFHIVKGRLLFTLYSQCYSLSAGNYFFVPAGNIYNIQNISNEECILVFTHIKGSRSESE